MGKKYIKEAKRIIDIGSGAGFPSLPLKILYPEKEFLLLDSLNKRIGFLNEVICQLNIKNIETLHARIEDTGREKKYREKFDVVLARAVAKLPTLVEYAMPLLKIGGKLVAYKSKNIEEEIECAENAIKKLFCKIVEKEKVVLSGTYERTFIVVEKLKETPKIYPRKGNKPNKEPL